MATATPARKPRAKARLMSKADICNLALLTDDDKRYLRDSDELTFSDGELERIADVDKLNDVLRGVLRVNPYDADRKFAARGYIYADDGRFYDDDMAPIGFELDWQSHVSECEGDAAATLLRHLTWDLAEHQKLLDAVVDRLRAADMIATDDDGAGR